MRSSRGRSLTVFAEPEDERLLIDGPEVTLDSRAVEAVGMSLHELATNAMKHGALGPAGGGIRLSWRIDRLDGPGDPPALAIRWDERSPAIVGTARADRLRAPRGHAADRDQAGRQGRIEFAPGRLSWQALLPKAHFTPGS